MKESGGNDDMGRNDTRDTRQLVDRIFRRARRKKQYAEKLAARPQPRRASSANRVKRQRALAAAAPPGAPVNEEPLARARFWLSTAWACRCRRSSQAPTRRPF